MSVLMEDIPYYLHNMVEIIGMDKFIEISKFYGGANVYIPVHHKVVMGERNREIKRLYNGNNIDKLRVKFGMTKQQLRKVIQDE